MAQEMTPADRIRELNEISSGIAETLRHMGQAINALSPNPQGDNGSIDARKEAFEEQSKAAYIGIQAFTARMRRQAYALEEAGIIAAQAPTLSSAAGSQQQAPGRPAAVTGAEAERITNGGLGKLDVGWLNSRGNKVGAEKEAELLQEAKELLRGELDRRTAAAEG